MEKDNYIASYMKKAVSLVICKDRTGYGFSCALLFEEYLQNLEDIVKFQPLWMILTVCIYCFLELSEM